MESNNYAIEINDLKKSYGKTNVLNGINLKINNGAIFCLLGINGAGKSTLIKILSTLLPLDSGNAFVCGNDVRSSSAKVRDLISLTGQYAAVDELLTGKENLIMASRLFHIKNPKKNADELLSRFNLTNKSDIKVSKYSGGMRRRLDIAMSLVGNPKVIFLDEPTTGLDPQSRIEMWNTIQKLSKSGITIFLTTQYLEEAEALAEHIAIIHNGKIIIEGTPEELKNQISETRINLSFANINDFIEAKTRLKEFDIADKESTLTIIVSTDGNVKVFARILSTLEDLNMTKVEQQKADLEEVFLKTIADESVIDKGEE